MTEIVRDDDGTEGADGDARPTSAPPMLPSVLSTSLSFGPLWARTNVDYNVSVYDNWTSPPLPGISFSNPPSPHNAHKADQWQQQQQQQAAPHHAHSHSLGSYASFGHGALPPVATRDSTPRSTPPLSSEYDGGSPNDEDEDEEKLVHRIEELQRRLSKMRASKSLSSSNMNNAPSSSLHPAAAAPLPVKTIMHSADAPLEHFVGRFLELATEQVGYSCCE